MGTKKIQVTPTQRDFGISKAFFSNISNEHPHFLYGSTPGSYLDVGDADYPMGVLLENLDDVEFAESS